MSASFVPVADAVVLASDGGGSKAPYLEAGDLVVLAAVGPPNTRYIFDSEVVTLKSLVNSQVYPVIDVSELVVLETYVTGPRQILVGRAFGFTLDNHPLYIVTLGLIGTFVYDISTGTWSQFETQGYNGIWNFEHGVEWNDGVYGGDNSTNQIWKLNPSSWLDDGFRPIQRVVTAGVDTDARNTIKTGALILNATVQNDVPASAEPATITLSISDDEGVTFLALDTITVTDRNQQNRWGGLGTIKAPGRIFHIADEGALVRLDGADLKVSGEKPS